jgi:uncharacterized protein YbjT (DUF2867 family)
METNPIVVIGATRGTGIEVVRALLQRGRPVRVVARNVTKARALFGPAVEVFEVDLARPTLALDDALRGAAGVVFTAAVPPGYAPETQLRAVDFGGVKATVEAARRAAFRGRFVYLTTMGVHRRTWLIRVLDVIKWNILRWRAEAERALRDSGLDVVIVRAGVLTNAPAGAALDIAEGDRPVGLSTRVSRADIAQVLLTALDDAHAARDLSVFAKTGAVARPLALPSRAG